MLTCLIHTTFARNISFQHDFFPLWVCDGVVTCQERNSKVCSLFTSEISGERWEIDFDEDSRSWFQTEPGNGYFCFFVCSQKIWHRKRHSKFKIQKTEVQGSTYNGDVQDGPGLSPAIWVKPEQFVWAQGLWDEIRCQKIKITRKMSTSTSDLWSLHRKIRRLAVKHQVSVELLTSYLTIYTSNIPDQNDQHRRSSTIYRVRGLINLSAVHPTHFEMSFDASTRGSGSPTSVTAHLNRRPFCLKALSYSSADFLDENVLTPALTTRDNSTLSCKYTDCVNNSILRSSWVTEINCLKQTGSIFEVWKMLISLVNLIWDV